MILPWKPRSQSLLEPLLTRLEWCYTLPLAVTWAYPKSSFLSMRRRVDRETLWSYLNQFIYYKKNGENDSNSYAAKLLQSCPTLCNPIDGSPPGSSVPGILQARTLEWVAISFSNAWKWKVKVKSLSHARLLATPCTGAYQAPPSMGFSRQEYWSGVPLPSPTISLVSFNLKHFLCLWLLWHWYLWRLHSHPCTFVF